jgi:hypothetical protein
MVYLRASQLTPLAAQSLCRPATGGDSSRGSCGLAHRSYFAQVLRASSHMRSLFSRSLLVMKRTTGRGYGLGLAIVA